MCVKYFKFEGDLISFLFFFSNKEKILWKYVFETHDDIITVKYEKRNFFL